MSEIITGLIDGFGPPTQKKRAVKIWEEGSESQYPKTLRVWQTVQEGGPNPDYAALLTAYESQAPVQVTYEVETYQTNDGDTRKSNTVRGVVVGGNGAALTQQPAPSSNPSPTQPATDPAPRVSHELVVALNAARSTVALLEKLVEGDAEPASSWGQWTDEQAEV